MKIRVVGAGAAGLSLAWFLRKKGAAVEVWEKSNDVGGLIRSEVAPEGVIECAAHTLVMTDAWQEILPELNVDIQQASPLAGKRYIYRNGHPCRWPLTVGESSRLATGFLWNKMCGGLPPRAGETVAQWGERVIGPGATRFLLSPGLQGIYGCSADQLSASLILGPLFRRKKNKYRGIFSTRTGLQEIFRAMRARLEKDGVIFHLDREYIGTQSDGPTVLCASLADAIETLEDVHPTLVSELKRIQSVPLVLVQAFYKGESGVRGFGVLIPENDQVTAKGVIKNSVVFPGRDTLTSESWFYGAPLIDMTDEEVGERLRADRRALFGEDIAPERLIIRRRARAIPKYDLALEMILPQLPSVPGLYLHGNYMGAVGVSGLLDKSRELAEKILGDAQNV